MPAAFLMQQMEWREQLDDAKGADSLDALRENVDSSRQNLLKQCAQLLDEQHDFPAAVLTVRELLFIEKFSQDLDRGFDQFE
jgi:molecular chaperone HscB